MVNKLTFLPATYRSHHRVTEIVFTMFIVLNIFPIKLFFFFFLNMGWLIFKELASSHLVYIYIHIYLIFTTTSTYHSVILDIGVFRLITYSYSLPPLVGWNIIICNLTVKWRALYTGDLYSICFNRRKPIRKSIEFCKKADGVTITILYVKTLTFF